jgi:ankyrin repeat protein
MKNDFIYFKGKSNEKILKALDKLSLEDKFLKALEYDLLWLVEKCIEDGFNPSKNIKSIKPIEMAAHKGRSEIVELLLNRKDVVPTEWTFIWVSKYCDTHAVKMFLNDKRVNPSDNDNQAIISAYNNNKKETIKLLLKDERVKSSLSESQKEYLKIK